MEAAATSDSPLIKAIDKTSVHRICSGQVVLTLAIAVKELVENSLDAGATQIDVKLKEHGSESVEVSDNGSGVKPENFAALTRKYHTSKLNDFSDLTSLHTFGFRGEALSSLCSLSKVTIITCHSTQDVGTKLEFDSSGEIVKQTPCPRQTGTTVTLQNLFYSLPVRYKEFQRNLRKEFNKMVLMLNAYSIISTGVRINCSNQVAKTRNQVLTVQSNASIRDNISNIFGLKQVQSIAEIKQLHPTEEVCSQYCIKYPDEDEIIFSISGYVSVVEHGKGRSTTDRQYVFINKRPCDFPKITKLCNDVYHQYNQHQYPFIALDISLATESVDVNVTKDKRTLFVEKEKLLLAIVKTSLLALFEPMAGQFKKSDPKLPGAFWTTLPTATQCEQSDGPTPSDDTVMKPLTQLYRSDSTPTSSPSLATFKRNFCSAFERGSSSSQRSPTATPSTSNKQRKLDYFVRKPRNNEEDDDDFNTTPSSFTAVQDRVESLSDNDDTSISTTTIHDNNHNNTSTSETLEMQHHPSNHLLHESVSSTTNASMVTDLFGTEAADRQNIPTSALNDEQISFADDRVTNFEPISSVSTSDIPPEDSSTRGEHSIIQQTLPGAVNQPQQTIDTHQLATVVKDGSRSVQKSTSKATTKGLPMRPDLSVKEVTVPFSLAHLKHKLQRKTESRDELQNDIGRSQLFRAKITPKDNENAEAELRKVISKDMFKQMKILGQFNLGFIITQLGDDLFIIDQHATDEKYNYEQLQANTIIQSQKLICPQNLELTAMNETILMENIEIFNKNGFEFDIDENGRMTERVKLTAMPVSKNWTFGKDDIEELIFMLNDSPGVLCRPSRIGQMFASRACRKSVMIGTALNMGEMKKLVGHMSEIDHPWNCPHGRPTMRHLINLKILPD